MRIVCETFTFRSAAKDAGMTRDEVDALTDMIATDPQAGNVMEGTGGCRKVRFARRGGGKSGGYRIITYYGGADLPVFLITVFGKARNPISPKASGTSSPDSPGPSPERTERWSSKRDRHDEQVSIR